MMSFVRFMTMAMAVALASTSSSFLYPSESVRNQYRTRDAPAEATNQLPKVKKPVVPELQTGCADGNIREGHREQEIDKKYIKEGATATRRRRSYVAWSGQVTYSVPYQSISVWKPPVYALERPYYIPVFGVAGRPPIYFPPQPLVVNPGVPKDNPNNFQGPQYLPPKEPTSTQVSLSDRFNGGDNYDDRPIWDMGNEEATTRSPSASFVPTRAPRPPPEAATPPPLIHGSTGGANSGAKVAESPSFNEVEDSSLLPPSRPLPTNRPPPATTSRNEPTRCVWAIISCCSTTKEISYDCFEERGCPGAFWDSSPCDSEFAKAAIAAALNYYN